MGENNLSFPCCKILVYDTSDTLTHTITTDIIECYTNDCCTSSSGSFKFVLPAMADSTNTYDDIGDFYKVKIYYGYDNSYTHLFSGRILNHTTSQHGDSARTFMGKGLSEILERRIKSDTQWNSVDAHDIVDELATDLSLSSDIDADTTELTLTVESQTYFDVLKLVSDYWASAVTQVQKDFGVDKDGVLFWKSRPLRSVGVETLTNILEYELTYDILPSKNTIKVYGAPTQFMPSTADSFTETTTDWTATTGTLSADADHQVGSFSIKVAQAVNGGLTIYYTLPDRITSKDTTDIFFHYKANTLGTARIELYAPDSSNSFYASLTADGNWQTFDHKLGSKYMAGSPYSGSDAVWYEAAGIPNWWNIQAVALVCSFSAAPSSAFIDGLYFFPVRPYKTVTDPVNIAAYEQRDLEVTSDTLLTEAECESHANTLLYQQKDRIIRFDPVLPGNTNILVGDRLSITLPMDNITATDFDVLSVENHYKRREFYKTIPHLINTAASRILPPKSILEKLQIQANRNRAIVTELYTKIVR